MATVWFPQNRQYEKEILDKRLERQIIYDHPLKPTSVMVTTNLTRKGGKGSRSSSVSSEVSTASSSFDPLTSSSEVSDPLSMMAATDPLSAASQPEQKPRTKAKQLDPVPQEKDDLDSSFEPWSMKKAGILQKYTTSEKLSITTSFLSPSDKEKVVTKQQSTVSDKVKNRLEQLDDFEEGSVKEMLNLSQTDYVNRIEELNNALIHAWDQDQRVKSLKIAIQCAKLLADVSVIQFYPSKFVLITDILDTFGRLVYERIKEKSSYIPKGSSIPVRLPDNFSADQVPDSAKETCRNWFFKIASIRELIPRLYVETAILKCYSYLTTGEYNQALWRLAVMSRGLGDPLVGIYARCYLCRVGIKVAPKFKDHLMPCFDDFLATYNQIQEDSVQNVLARQNLELPKYLTLYSPALDWILQCVAHGASEKVLEKILDKSKKHCNSALLLNSIMSAFKPEYISVRALQFCSMIRDCEESGFPKPLLYRTLGVCLVISEPPEADRLSILNDVWKVVMKLKDPAEYMGCAEIWIDYVFKHFGKREVNTILGDIIKHMTPDRAYEDFYPQLHSIVTKILTHVEDFSMLFTLEKFLPLVDLFQKESVKVDVCKSIVEVYTRKQTDNTNDPVIISTLMFICKTMHDSVNALTLDDEVRVIGGLINNFIKSVSFGKDFEQQLGFYVEARASFSNIDIVIAFLVQCVNNLAMNTKTMVKGNHTRKTAVFVRACVAYSFITIPSLNGIFTRLNLYLFSGHVALQNQCLSQADAFFKATVSLLPEVPKFLEVDSKLRSTEPLLIEFLNNLLSALLIVPDNPDQGVLYLIKGLLNVLSSYPWDNRFDSKSIAYISVLCMLSAAHQEELLYHIDKVDSNDTMYGYDQKYLSELDKISTTVLSEIYDRIKELNSPECYKRQSLLSFEVFSRIIAHGNLDNDQMFELAVNMWAVAQKHGQLDSKLMARTLEYVKRKGDGLSSSPFTKLSKKMPLHTSL